MSFLTISISFLLLIKLSNGICPRALDANDVCQLTAADIPSGSGWSCRDDGTCPIYEFGRDGESTYDINLDCSEHKIGCQFMTINFYGGNVIMKCPNGCGRALITAYDTKSFDFTGRAHVGIITTYGTGNVRLNNIAEALVVMLNGAHETAHITLAHPGIYISAVNVQNFKLDGVCSGDCRPDIILPIQGQSHIYFTNRYNMNGFYMYALRGMTGLTTYCDGVEGAKCAHASDATNHFDIWMFYGTNYRSFCDYNGGECDNIDEAVAIGNDLDDYTIIYADKDVPSVDFSGLSENIFVYIAWLFDQSSRSDVFDNTLRGPADADITVFCVSTSYAKSCGGLNFDFSLSNNVFLGARLLNGNTITGPTDSFYWFGYAGSAAKGNTLDLQNTKTISIIPTCLQTECPGTRTVWDNYLYGYLLAESTMNIGYNKDLTILCKNWGWGNSGCKDLVINSDLNPQCAPLAQDWDFQMITNKAGDTTINFASGDQCSIRYNNANCQFFKTSDQLDPAIVSDPEICVPQETSLKCPANKTFIFDWDELTELGDNEIDIDAPFDHRIPNVDVVMDINKTDLSLNFIVSVEYVVRAFADDQRKANFGTTYVLDFEDFDAHHSSITKPNTCQNRREMDYNGLTFDERYKITDNFDDIGTVNNMCYPPPGDELNGPITGWTIDTEASDCDNIVYRGHFPWARLRSCKNSVSNSVAPGEEQTFVDNNGEYLTLSGTFYINMISPFWNKNNDLYGRYYRVYQLHSQPFVIQVSKSVYVIGSTNVNVMSMSIISVYKEDMDKDYTLIVLTETAEYMKLTNPTRLQLPISDQFTLEIQTESESNDCLNNKAFLCSQLWRIYAVNTVCNNDKIGNEGGIDFGGNYQLKFEPDCRTGTDEGNNYDFNDHCTEWLSAHPNFDPNNENGNGAGVELSSTLTFVDEICKPKVFTVQLLAEMKFYEDSLYENIIGPNSAHLYQVGVDFVYGEIVLNFPSSTETIFDSKLINVWLCTFPPDTDVTNPNQNGPNANPTVYEADNGGCFSTKRDGFTDGENSHFFFHIYDRQQTPILSVEEFEITTRGNDGNDVIKFKFIVPDEIQRDTLFIHAQIEVLLEEITPSIPEVRRVLLSSSTSKTNRISHFGGQIGITNDKKHDKKPQIPQQPLPQNPNPNIYTPMQGPSHIINTAWIMVIGAFLAIILLFNIVFMCYMNYCNNNGERRAISFNKNKRNGYNSVKYADSEEFYDSEANLINVNQ